MVEMTLSPSNLRSGGAAAQALRALRADLTFRVLE